MDQGREIVSIRANQDHDTLVTQKIGAHIRSTTCYLICLRHLIRSKANRIFFLRNDLFSFMRTQHVLSYRPILVPRAGPGAAMLAVFSSVQYKYVKSYRAYN